MALAGLACLAAASLHGAAAAPPAHDPLANYYGNTLICAAAASGRDLCHLWLYRDGTFINFDFTGGHRGHYKLGPVRPDGKVPVCQYWDTPNMVMPKELMPAPGHPPGVSPTSEMLCKTADFRTTCRRVEPSTLNAADRAIAARTMGERFHAGLCYPIGPHTPGDVWFENDDPLPGELGKDKLLLVRGHR